MLPSKNRLQAKKILQSPRSVVISSAPVFNKGYDKEKEKSGSREPNGKDTHDIKSEADASTSKSPAGTPTTTSAATAGLAESATGTGDRSSFVDGSGALEGQQYTYVTDESGYTWLYDNVYGQYYYYDNIQGTYVMYNQQGEVSSGNYPGTQSYAPDGGEADDAKVDQSSNNNDGKTKRGKPHKQRRTVRLAGGQVWEDSTLDDWPANDYRLFAGDLGPETTSEMLQQTFGKFRTLQRTHVVMDKKTGKSRGYGFLSFGDADDFLAAWKEFNGKYVGSRPIKLRKSTWKERDADIRKVKRLDKRALLEFRKGR